MGEFLNVIKVGGAVVEEAASMRAFLEDFAELPGCKVLVHGGGRTATAVAARLSIESRIVAGRRATDAEMLKVVTMVYGGLVNKSVVATLQSLSVNAFGLTGADMNCILGHKRPVGEIDYGFVGDIDKVENSALSALIASGLVPVIAPLIHDGKGNLLNTNADTVASSVASALAENYEVTLTYCFEKPGVLADSEDEASVIPVITPSVFEALTASGTISGGMIPKLQNAFDALAKGVSKVVITSSSNLSGGTAVLQG